MQPTTRDSSEEILSDHLIDLDERIHRTADQEIIDTATIFVNELIEQAQQDVIKKKEESMRAAMEEREQEDNLSSIQGLLRRGERWHSRARGIVTRLLTSLRICK